MSKKRKYQLQLIPVNNNYLLYWDFAIFIDKQTLWHQNIDILYSVNWKTFIKSKTFVTVENRLIETDIINNNHVL